MRGELEEMFDVYINNVCESVYNICHSDDKWANHVILSHILPRQPE